MIEPTPDQSYCDVGRHQQCSDYTEDEGDPETCMCNCHDEELRLEHEQEQERFAHLKATTKACPTCGK